MQNKKTDVIDVDLSAIDMLDELTSSQYQFVLGLLDETITDRDAYKRAYPNQHMKDTSISVEICKLKAHPKISLIIKALKLQGLGQSLEDRRAHVERLRELSQQAQEAGNYGAAVNAEVNAGKVAGHYIERTENINETRKQELEDRIALLSNDKTQDKGESKGEALH